MSPQAGLKSASRPSSPPSLLPARRRSGRATYAVRGLPARCGAVARVAAARRCEWSPAARAVQPARRAGLVARVGALPGPGPDAARLGAELAIRRRSPAPGTRLERVRLVAATRDAGGDDRIGGEEVLVPAGVVHPPHRDRFARRDGGAAPAAALRSRLRLSHPAASRRAIRVTGIGADGSRVGCRC